MEENDAEKYSEFACGTKENNKSNRRLCDPNYAEDNPIADQGESPEQPVYLEEPDYTRKWTKSSFHFFLPVRYSLFFGQKLRKSGTNVLREWVSLIRMF